MTAWSALGNASPWAAFLSLCLGLVVAYQRGWIVSAAEYKRVLAENERSADRAVEVEQRIAGFHEKRAEIAEARADRADAALAKLNAELPSALHALARSNASTP